MRGAIFQQGVQAKSPLRRASEGQAQPPFSAVVLFCIFFGSAKSSLPTTTSRVERLSLSNQDILFDLESLLSKLSLPLLTEK